MFNQTENDNENVLEKYGRNITELKKKEIEDKELRNRTGLSLPAIEKIYKGINSLQIFFWEKRKKLTKPYICGTMWNSKRMGVIIW